jgi:hypothetical protein
MKETLRDGITKFLMAAFYFLMIIVSGATVEQYTTALTTLFLFMMFKNLNEAFGHKIFR